MSKKLQVKDSEKKSAIVQRTASYRLALRRSAPPTEAEDLMTKNEEKDNRDNSPETDKKVITSQPSNEKKVSIDDSNGVQTEPLIIDHKTNGDNDLKSIEFMAENTVDGENVCTKFCRQTICCHYCQCCPNWCSLRMRSLETFLIQITDCGLNCLRVFT